MDVLAETRKILQEWANKQGHERCHWHPDILQKLADLHGIKPTVQLELPPRAEFEAGCKRYQDQQYTIKDVMEEIVVFLKERQEPMSGFEIAERLGHQWEHVNEAMGYLIDAKRVGVKDLKYVVRS